MTVGFFESKLAPKPRLNIATQSRGFTMLELLISIAIFSMIGMAAYAMLSGVQRTEQASKAFSTEFKQFQRAFWFMGQDVTQMALRQRRDDGEEPSEQLFQLEQYLLSSEADGASWIRSGWSNPLNQLPRGQLQWVGYRLTGENLERLTLPYPDIGSGVEPKVRVLLEGVTGFEIEVYHDDGWKEEFSEPLILPRAVLFRVTSSSFGVVERKFIVTQPMFADDSQ